MRTPLDSVIPFSNLLFFNRVFLLSSIDSSITGSVSGSLARSLELLKTFLKESGGASAGATTLGKESAS